MMITSHSNRTIKSFLTKECFTIMVLPPSRQNAIPDKIGLHGTMIFRLSLQDLVLFKIAVFQISKNWVCLLPHYSSKWLNSVHSMHRKSSFEDRKLNSLYPYYDYTASICGSHFTLYIILNRRSVAVFRFAETALGNYIDLSIDRIL